MELVVNKTTSLGLTAAELCSGVPIVSVIMEKLKAKCDGKCDGVCYIISVEEIVSHTQPYLSADSGDGSGFLTVVFIARTLQYGPQYLTFAPITLVHVDSRFICENPTSIFNALDRSEMLTGAEAHQKQFVGLHIPLVISASTYVAGRKSQCIVSMMRGPPTLNLAWGSPTINEAQREYIATQLKRTAPLGKPAAAALKALSTTLVGAALAKSESASKWIAAQLKSPDPEGAIQVIIDPEGPAVRRAATGGKPSARKAAEPVQSPVMLGFVLATVAEYIAVATEFRRQLAAAIVTEDDLNRHKAVWNYYKKL